MCLLISFSMSWLWQCWICHQLCKGEDIPSYCTNPEELFVTIMDKNPNFGRYAVYMVWLQRTFPTEGEQVWRYLKRRFPQWQYSFTYLLGRWLWYHVQKSLGL